MPVDAVAITECPFPLMALINVLYKCVLPLPPEPSIKKTIVVFSGTVYSLHNFFKYNFLFRI